MATSWLAESWRRNESMTAVIFSVADSVCIYLFSMNDHGFKPLQIIRILVAD